MALVLRASNNNQPAVANQPAPSAEQPEGYLGYAVRNLAKTPTVLAETVGSLGGLGDLLNLLQRESVNPAYKNLQKIFNEEGQGMGAPRVNLLPTHESINERLSSVLPQYLTEHRPEDAWPRFLQGQAVPFALSGGFSSVPNAIRAATGLAGMNAGAYAGEKGAEALGAGPVGQALTGLAGGFAGGYAAHAIADRPSKRFPREIEAKKRTAFEEGKAKRIGELGQEYEPQLAAQREALIEHELQGVTNKKQFEENKKTLVQDAIRENEAFEINKKEQINQIKKDNFKNIQDLKKENILNKNDLVKQRKAREARIEELKGGETTELYEKAKRTGAGITEESPEISEALQTIKDSMLGVEESDQLRIFKMGDQLEALMQREGGLPLNDAVTMTQNLNTILSRKKAYDPRIPQPPALPDAVSKYYMKINEALKSYIERVGAENPEFAESYIPAKQRTIEKKNLQKEFRAFDQAQKIAAREIEKNYKERLRDQEKSFSEEVKRVNQEKYPLRQELKKIKEEKYPSEQIYEYKATAKDLANELKTTKKEYEQARKSIDKETYDSLFATERKQEAMLNRVEKIASASQSWGLGSLLAGITKYMGADWLTSGAGLAIGKLATKVYQESKYAAQVFAEHPDLFNKYAADIFDAIKKDSPALVTLVDRLGREVQQYSQAEEKPKRGLVLRPRS